MDSPKLVVKLFVADQSAIKPADFLPIFHSWIQMHAVPDHLLIDVADYKHVRGGPGTVLVAHEANFSMDAGDGRLGLLYVRKQPIEGSFRDRLAVVFKAALDAAVRLEEDYRLEGRIKFRTDEIVFRINDRLLAPNTAETYAQVRPDLEALVSELYGSAIRTEHRADAGRLFEVVIRPTGSPSARSLQDRMTRPAGV